MVRKLGRRGKKGRRPTRARDSPLRKYYAPRGARGFRPTLVNSFRRQYNPFKKKRW